MKLLILSFVVIIQLALCTDVKQCKSVRIDDIKERAQLKPCKKTPCKLRKGTTPTVDLRFKPQRDISELTNSVVAYLGGVPLPFIGVDGKSVCDKIYSADDPSKKSPCPLKAGQEYVYKDSFKVQPFYPSVSVNIHWSLKDRNDDVICFEVPAFIV